MQIFDVLLGHFCQRIRHFLVGRRQGDRENFGATVRIVRTDANQFSDGGKRHTAGIRKLLEQCGSPDGPTVNLLNITGRGAVRRVDSIGQGDLIHGIRIAFQQIGIVIVFLLLCVQFFVNQQFLRFQLFGFFHILIHTFGRRGAFLLDLLDLLGQHFLLLSRVIRRHLGGQEAVPRGKHCNHQHGNNHSPPVHQQLKQEVDQINFLFFSVVIHVYIPFPIFYAHIVPMTAPPLHGVLSCGYGTIAAGVFSHTIHALFS